MNSFKKAAAAIAVAGLMLPVGAFAQTATSTTASSTQALLDQLKTLQLQIQTAQSQQQTILGQLAVTLNMGAKGENVKMLQQLLSQDSSVYPEGTISGFFGKNTAKAVKRFQKKHGLPQAGNVGPKTLKMLNEIFGHNGTSTEDNDHHNNHNHGTTTVSHGDGDKHDNDADEHDNDDHKPCFAQGRMTAPGFLKNFGEHGNKKFKGNEGNGKPCVATTTTDMTAPVISAVSAASLTAGGATIVWTTNENASSQVEFGTSTSYGSMSTLNVSLSMTHSVVLTGLVPNTMYNFRVWSKDAANNAASSSNMTFTTLALDTTAPALSSIVSGSIATTSALISWNTNENSTGKVYFGTTNPLVLGSAMSQATTTLSSTHSFSLTGLSASTTYYFVVESKDAANNTATSSQMSFTTTN